MAQQKKESMFPAPAVAAPEKQVAAGAAPRPAKRFSVEVPHLATLVVEAETEAEALEKYKALAGLGQTDHVPVIREAAPAKSPEPPKEPEPPKAGAKEPPKPPEPPKAGTNAGK